MRVRGIRSGRLDGWGLVRGGKGKREIWDPVFGFGVWCLMCDLDILLERWFDKLGSTFSGWLQ